MTDRSNSSLNLAIPDEKGKAPKERLGGIIEALSVASVLIESNKERWRIGARTQGMFDGNPPYNPAELRRAGMLSYPNINFLEGKAMRSSALVPYYDLFSNVPIYADIQLDMEDKQAQDEASRVNMEEFDLMLRDSEWFDFEMQEALNDFMGFGKCFLYWDNPHDMAFEHIPWHRVVFPDKTKMKLANWKLFMVLRLADPVELYNKVRNQQRAKDTGWNYEAVMHAIRASAAPYDPSVWNDWPEVQNQLRDHDLSVTTQVDKVWVGNIFVQEFDGRWSHLMVPLSGASQHQPFIPSRAETNAQPGKREEYEHYGYLFKHIGRYASVRQIVAPFFFEVLNGSINGCSGLGKDIMAPMQIKDRGWCARWNSGFMRSTIVLQPQSQMALDKLRLTTIQNTTILPPGTAVQESKIFGDIESLAILNQQTDQMLSQNTGIYRPQFDKAAGNPPTAAEFNTRASMATALTSSAVNRFMKQLDPMYAELYRRAQISSDTEAKEYRARCDKRGVDSKIRGKTRFIRAYRNTGGGSVMLRQQQYAALLPILGHLPADGQANLIQDFVASFTSQQKVERYMPLKNREVFADRHAWEATEENDSLQTGGAVTWYPGQNDLVHLAVHAAAGQQALQSLQQGGNPMSVATFIGALIQHAEGTHLAILQKNGRTKEAKPFLMAFQELKAAQNKLAGMLQRAQQQQQQQMQKQQGVMSDAQLKAMKTQNDMALKTAKTRHGMQLKEAQVRQNLQLKDASTASEIMRKQHAAFAAEMTGGNGE